jgi:hypothetical protein
LALGEELTTPQHKKISILRGFTDNLGLGRIIIMDLIWLRRETSGAIM